jgi:hypothetical protein
MPLVRKQSGWFWGSKGPFDSKAKALAVARAAYASGYKGENKLEFGVDMAIGKEQSVKISQEFFKKPD